MRLFNVSMTVTKVEVVLADSFEEAISVLKEDCSIESVFDSLENEPCIYECEEFKCLPSGWKESHIPYSSEEYPRNDKTIREHILDGCAQEFEGKLLQNTSSQSINSKKEKR